MNNSLLITSVLNEVKSPLRDKDYDLATRLLIDVITDSELDSRFLQKAIQLRADQMVFSQDGGSENFHQLENELWKLIEDIEEIVSPNRGRSIDQIIQEIQPLYAKPIKIDEQTVYSGANLVKEYNNSNFQLGPIDVTLQAGEITGVVGENGNGKTTLLRIIAGELQRSMGSITYPRFDYKNEHDWYAIKQNIAFIPQALPKWRGYLKDNLHFAAANHGVFGKENEKMVKYIIHRLGLSKYINSKWKDISSGYKLRFELAKALVWRPKLLVLDEPLANLDINAKLLFMQDLRMLANIRKYPVTIILSSQQLHEIESVVDNIIFLKEGSTVYNGAVKDFGEKRTRNSFEVGGEFNRDQLYECLKSIEEVTISDTGQSLIIEVPVGIEGKVVLNLITKEYMVEYFRDISKSTRKLF